MASISSSVALRNGCRLISRQRLLGQQRLVGAVSSSRLQQQPFLHNQQPPATCIMNHNFSTSAAQEAVIPDENHHSPSSPEVDVTTSEGSGSSDPTTTATAATATATGNETTTTTKKNTAAKKKKKRRRVLQAKDPIIVTERAAERIKELLAGDNAQGAIGIILGVKRRGCNGLSYTMNYAFEEPKDSKSGGAGASMTAHGVQFFIEPMALFNVVGTKMDWEEDELTSEFTFNNPNSKGECGCGESFNV